MAVDEDVEKTTEDLISATASVIAHENPGFTDEEMARELEKTLCLSPDVVSAKVEIVPESEDEKVVREVMEAPERFTVNLQMVLRSPMPTMEVVYKVGEERISVGPAEEEEVSKKT